MKTSVPNLQYKDKPLLNKLFWIGFGQINAKYEHCALIDPMYGWGMNSMVESIGYRAYWYEFQIFAGGKPMFRYKTENFDKVMVVWRYLGLCWVRIYQRKSKYS